MSQFELDHLFVSASPGAPEIEPILALGLLEGTRNVHPGQGTANRRIFFHNVMLEFLWLTDAEEARSEVIRRTGLADRADPMRQDVCPFGVCLRAVDGADYPLPFATWDYRPPYLPPGMSIPMAESADKLNEPLIFAIPFGGRPDHYPADRRQPIEHPAGLRQVTKVTMTLPTHERSPALCYLHENDIVSIIEGEAYHLALTFDHAVQGRRISLMPALPLSLLW